MTTTSDTPAVTTTTNTEYRIMRRLPPGSVSARSTDWHEWEHLSPKCARENADRRLALYRTDPGEYRLEERTVVTMSSAWELAE